MKVMAVNGSPRKNWNTAALLKSALEGAASAGAETELVNLYDLDYKGCISCFSCKKSGGKSYGRCAVRDALTPVLERAGESDAIVMGSPIYLGEVTGELRSFIERLIFPYLVYDKERSTLFGKRIRAAFIYTMNVSEERMEELGYRQHFELTESIVSRILGDTKSLYSTDTMQFDDYSKYVIDLYDGKAKAERHSAIFPGDCMRAGELGMWLAGR